MRLTHLGHSAVLVETDDARVLIDPGNFSDGWHGLTDLDAILITHSHPDHADPEHLPGLVRANPHAKVYVEPSIVLAEEAGKFPEVRADALAAGEQVVVGDLLVTAVGGQTAVPGGVDILAVPMMGPWAAMKETIDFVREVGALEGFPIHDGLLNERGRGLIYGRVVDMTGTRLTDLRGGTTHEF